MAVSDSLAFCASAFARSTCALASSASSFAFFKATSASASLRWVCASDAFAVWASSFARSTSLFVSFSSLFRTSCFGPSCFGPSCFGTSFSGAGKAVVGCAVGVESDGAGLVDSAPEAADLRARTPRAISRQVRSSVLLDSPPVVARVTQCRLSSAEKADHPRFNCTRTACSLSMHC